MPAPKTSDGQKLYWDPPGKKKTPINDYRKHVNEKYNKSFETTSELQRWSVENDNEFWLDLYTYLGLTPSLPSSMTRAYDESVPMSKVPMFFQGLDMNYAENALFSNPDDESIAVIGVREAKDLSQGEEERLTWKQLRERVREFGSALTRSGVKRGDRVAALVSNSVRAVVIFLACASKGIIFTSINPDLGNEGCISRLLQVTPTILFADSDGTYKGKRTSIVPKIDTIVQRLEQKPKVYVIPLTETDTNHYPLIDEFLGKASSSDKLAFVRVPFTFPLFIVYSSGTTGAPKCIVHQHGLILQLKKISTLHSNLGPGDMVMQFTTTTWVMFQILMGHLSCGCTIICYDGSPMYPDVKQMLRIIEKYRVTYFGTSPRLLLELEISGTVPKKEFDLESLLMVNTTGAPLSQEQYLWFYNSFPYHSHLSNTAGGTDVCTSLLCSDTFARLYFGEIPTAALGTSIDILDDKGNSIKYEGKAGEMVITKPFPSMPPFFWADPDGQKYFNAYFGHFDDVDVWGVSDWLSFNPETEGYIMHGRSDGVLNPSGIRFGSGEIYAVVEAPPFNKEIAETLCVGRRRQGDNDEKVFLFVKMNEGSEFTEDLKERLKKSISQSLSPRHVPKFIIEVEDIPATINGKKIEVATKQIISGRDVGTSAMVANPETLKGYKKFRDVEHEPRASKL